MKPIYSVNQDFFKSWNPQMAYILGFTCADGCVHGRSLSWELSNKHSSDKSLLERFNNVMNSNYKIELRKKSFRLRIHNPEILRDLRSLNVVQNKTKFLLFPPVPGPFLKDFIRGVLDADGWVTATIKRNGCKEISVGFCGGSFAFMNELVSKLRDFVGLSQFNLRTREKLTPKGVLSITYQLEFYSKNALALINFLYGGVDKRSLFLERKFDNQLKARAFFNESQRNKFFGRKWQNLEKSFDSSLDLILKDFLSRNLLPREIASVLGISLATLYRWMDKAKVRAISERGSEEWTNRMLAWRKIANDC